MVCSPPRHNLTSDKLVSVTLDQVGLAESRDARVTPIRPFGLSSDSLSCWRYAMHVTIRLTIVTYYLFFDYLFITLNTVNLNIQLYSVDPI